MTAVCRCDSPLGPMLLAASGRGICGVWFENQRHFPVRLRERALISETPLLSELRRWLDDYFAGKNPALTRLPLDLAGTPFQRLIWQLLSRIPYGETTSYGMLAVAAARELDRPSMSAQAVGGAVGRNPVSIVVPCHRVLGSDGALTGYAGGLDRKRFLLALESGDRPPSAGLGETSLKSQKK